MMRATGLGLSLRDVPASREPDAMTQPAALDSVRSGVSSNASALLQVLVPGRGTDVASCDWDALFDAVKDCCTTRMPRCTTPNGAVCATRFATNSEWQ